MSRERGPRLDPTRRDVLKGLAAVGAVAASGLSPDRAEAKLFQRDRWQSHLPGEIILPGEQYSGEVEVTPEYERTLEQLLLIQTGDFYVLENPVTAENSMRLTYEGILRNLPSYTKLRIIAEEKFSTVTQKILKELHLTERTTLYQVSTEKAPDIWAQDLFEVTLERGRRVALIPKLPSPRIVTAERRADYLQRYERRPMMIKAALGEDNVRQAKFVFDGGNLTPDMIDGRLVLFVGHDVITDTLETYRDEGKRLTERNVAELISEDFAGAAVVVMGNQEQPAEAFHIDQSFVLPRPGVALVNRYRSSRLEAFKINSVGGNVSQREQEQYRALREQSQYYQKQLDHLGYDTHALSNGLRDSYYYKSSMNGIPFLNKDTGRYTCIFPVYDKEVMGELSGTVLQRDQLQGKALEMYALCQKLDIDPRPIANYTGLKWRGATHCAVNVLASATGRSHAAGVPA